MRILFLFLGFFLTLRVGAEEALSPWEMASVLEKRMVAGEGVLFPDASRVASREAGTAFIDDSWPAAFFSHAGETIFVQVSPVTGLYEFFDERGEVFWCIVPEAPLTWNWPAPFLRPFSASFETDALLAPWRFVDAWHLEDAEARSAIDVGCPERIAPSTIRRAGAVPSPISSLCFTAFSPSPSNLLFVAAWPPNDPPPDATLDLWSATNLLQHPWTVWHTETNAVTSPHSFSVPASLVPNAGAASPHRHDETCPVVTNMVLSPLDGETLYTNIVWGCTPQPTAPETAFFASAPATIRMVTASPTHGKASHTAPILKKPIPMETAFLMVGN